jgi:hypothetical protein
MNTKVTTFRRCKRHPGTGPLARGFHPNAGPLRKSGCYYLRVTIFAISADLADGFISKLGKRKSRRVDTGAIGGVFAKVGAIRFRLSPSPMGSSAQPPQRSEVYSLEGSNGAPTVHF